jgi:hypothetical protein
MDISHIAVIGCILFQVVQNCVLGIPRCLDTSKQRESYEGKKISSMGFIGIEKNSHTKQHLKQLAYGH